MKDDHQMSEREMRYWLKQFGVEVGDDEVFTQKPEKPIKISQNKSFENIKIGSVNRSDRETLDKLKKGKFPVRAKLDLHGYGLQQAREKFYEFINSAAQIGVRVVLVVTGKGNFSGGVGKIKTDLPYWINDSHLKPHILTCCYAPKNMGGEGAILILLTK